MIHHLFYVRVLKLNFTAKVKTSSVFSSVMNLVQCRQVIYVLHVTVSNRLIEIRVICKARIVKLSCCLVMLAIKTTITHLFHHVSSIKTQPTLNF